MSTAQAARSDVRVTHEPLTFGRGGPSFFNTILNASLGSAAARSLLQRHREEMKHERPAAVGRAAEMARRDGMQFDLNSSTPSGGGYLVAPKHLQDDYLPVARAARVTTNAIGTRPLPAKTNELNVPRGVTGGSTATHADGAAVSETDPTLGADKAAVKTVAGMADASVQLVERSSPGVDDVIYADLAASIGTNLNAAVINSNVPDNLGLLQTPSPNLVTYTDASPTVAELYPHVGNGVRQIIENVFAMADAVFMAPRRWAWALSVSDTAGRPIVTPIAPAVEPGMTASDIAGLGMPVGTMQGVPVWIDPSIPTTLGAGNNEDRIIVVRSSDLRIWEDPEGPYIKPHVDPGSGTMTVRFTVRNAWAQCHVRRNKAISVIAGTGLAAPTWP